jgi:DHA2 family multidrug resistance protein
VQANHAELSEFIHPYAWAMQQGAGLDHLHPMQSLALINAEVSRQAAAMAYLQDFHLMMWVTLAALPLALLLRDPRQAGPSLARD